MVRGYHAEVDLSALGMGLRAITEIRLAPDTPRAVRGDPASHTRGAARHARHRGLDYVLMLACADVATLDRLLSHVADRGRREESSTRIILRDVELSADRPTVPD